MERTMLRSVVAVLAGFGVVVLMVMAGTALAVRLVMGAVDPTAPLALPPAYLALNLAVSALAALLGGYVAGRLAPVGSRTPVLVLAALLLVLGLATMLGAPASGDGQPAWYQWLLLVLGPAGVLLGGRLQQRAAPARPDALPAR